MAASFLRRASLDPHLSPPPLFCARVYRAPRLREQVQQTHCTTHGVALVGVGPDATATSAPPRGQQSAVPRHLCRLSWCTVAGATPAPMSKSPARAPAAAGDAFPWNTYFGVQCARCALALREHRGVGERVPRGTLGAGIASFSGPVPVGRVVLGPQRRPRDAALRCGRRRSERFHSAVREAMVVALVVAACGPWSMGGGLPCAEAIVSAGEVEGLRSLYNATGGPGWTGVATGWFRDGSSDPCEPVAWSFVGCSGNSTIT